ncbi:MAG: citrate/2-methylcitrate synthase [Spirochaetota bacterium]|nr:citrate/2-methylcitrate synthase [Spirochaetota bacterium]
MDRNSDRITELILKASKKVHKETKGNHEPEFTKIVKWPVECIVGPGLEGAIACETNVGYVNGSKGSLIYWGYDIFDLCAYSSFEEVCYLLLHGHLPSTEQLDIFKNKLIQYRNTPNTTRLLMSFPVEKMNAMGALRLGTNLLRQEFTDVDQDLYVPNISESEIISADEDSIPMETPPRGEEHAIYEFKEGLDKTEYENNFHSAIGYESCYHLIAGVSTIAAAVKRLRHGNLPIEPDPELSHAANFLYMMNGRRPSPVEERIMDVSLILHADHGMNASTFAAMVVASTLSDIYFSVGSGISALNGPLHGGANEQVLKMLLEIGGAENVDSWFDKAREAKRRIMGFGHRVYKTYDPRARVLSPLAEYLAKGNKENLNLFSTAQKLEERVVSELGKEKKIFPNVDFYSGIVYSCLGIPIDMFTPIFAVSRVGGWTARVQEYLKNNRIFRPRAVYNGPFDKEYIPIDGRSSEELK